jgi:hypothetical protein
MVSLWVDFMDGNFTVLHQSFRSVMFNKILCKFELGMLVWLIDF